MFELVFLSGPRGGEVLPITKTLLAGRSPECSLEVPDPNASRKHTHLVFDGTSLTAADNGSSNGTFVNDVRITAPVQLKHGDVVRLGETRLRIQQKAQGQALSQSSIFGFKDASADEDLSQSIVMSAVDVAPKRNVNAEVLSTRLAAIMRMSKALVSIDKPEEVYQGILEALFEVFPQAERGFLMHGSTADQLEPRALKSRGQAGTEGLVISKSICRKALDSRTAFLFNDQNASDFDQGMSIVSLRIRSAMTIPLMVGEEVTGLLQVDTGDPARAFTLDDLELAVSASRIAAAAVRNAELLKKVESETATRNNLLRFLPGPLAEQVLSGSLDIALGGKTYQGTILFSDIIGFTRMSEGMEPSGVIAVMNDYFARMVPCIEREGGSVDKFIGDAIMAFWGIPFDRGDAAVNAVHAALDMQNGLQGLNTLLRAEGRPELQTGIGLNSGTVVAGNIGHAQRSEYTILGDAVNTASRIEHAAGRGQVLVSGATFTELKGRGFGIRMPPLHAKNKAEPLTVLSLRGLGLGDEILLHLPLVCGGKPVVLVRRLADHSFIALHGAECDPCGGTLSSGIVEWPQADLGTATMLSVLPVQATDGALIRSQLRLSDDTLGGLLGTESPVCPVSWDQLPR